MYAHYAVRSNSAVHSIRVYLCESKCVCVGWKLLVEGERWNNASYVEDTLCTLCQLNQRSVYSKHWTHWLLQPVGRGLVIITSGWRVVTTECECMHKCGCGYY